MGDTYTGLVNTAFGRTVASRLGLPRPATLRRYAPGDPLVPGPVLVGGHGTAPLVAGVRELLDRESVDVVTAAAPESRVGAVVVDLSTARHPDHLEQARTLVGPVLRNLAPSGRVVLLGAAPEDAGSEAAVRATRRALEGLVRSIGKELRAGATANLVQVAERAGAEHAGAEHAGPEHAGGERLVAERAEPAVQAAVRFLLSGRSAYVDGQVLRVHPTSRPFDATADPARPLDGKVAVVTGAARGIGAATAEVLSRDGATLVCVDVPAAGEALARVANRLGGTALQLDVTQADAGARIVGHARSRHGSLDVVVHNAGITRDRLLANLDHDRWASVLEVNLTSVLRMNEAILTPDGLSDGGRVVCVSSVAGLAGNRGQSNYAASKAGIVGLVEALAAAPELAERGVTVNAVAPGFIETEMTARIPLMTREVGRRLSSLQQGGLPVDVAEAVAWLCQDASAGVSGSVVRVCGQSFLGA